MSSGGFSSTTKMNYSRGIVPSQVNVPGSNFYANMYGNAQLLNEINNFLNSHPKASPPGPKPEPVYKTKIIAILNFNDAVYDQPIIKTLKYYFKNVPRFYTFPIVDYGGDTTKLLKLLTKYYNKGFRYFLTATLSPAVTAIMPWFAEHPDAQAVSSASRSLVLNVPKSIYRLQYPNIMPVTEKELIGDKDAVFFVYNSANSSSVVWNNYLSNRCSTLGVPYYPYPVSNSSTITDTSFVNVTMDAIQQYVVDNSYTNISVTCALFDWQDLYYNKFEQGVTTTPSNSTFYNLAVFAPKITQTPAINYFVNVPLYAQIAGYLNSSPLWRKGFEALGEDNYSRNTLNMMEMLYKLEQSNGYIFEIGAHSDALLFDLVTRDGAYESYMYELFTADGFEPKIIYFRSTDGVIFKSEF